MAKRILCLLLVFVMLFGVCATLASCGNKENKDPNYRDEGDRTPDEFDDENDAAVGKYYEYTWSTTNLNVEISEHTAEQELISRTRRYLAGEDDKASEPLDDQVRTRNARAEKVTRTKIKYTYLADNASNGWGKSMARIAKEAKAGADNTADVYINFIYDLVGASLQKAFANLRSTTMLGAAGKNVTGMKLISVPQNPTMISDVAVARKVMKLYDLLDDYDDTMNVFANFEIDEAVLEQL